MQPALVSIIVPAYNYANYLPETMESILAQSYLNWECIIVDDGSKDNTAEVAKFYAAKDPRIHYVYQDNQGLSGARNTGVKHCKGEFIQLLDADDLIQPEKLEQQIKGFEKHPEADILYSEMRFFDDGHLDKLRKARNNNVSWTLNRSGTGHKILNYLVVSCGILVCMPLIRTRVFEKVGEYTKLYSEDWDFWLRAAILNINWQYYPAPNSLSLIRIHQSSITVDKGKIIPGSLDVRERMSKILPGKRLKKLNQRFWWNTIIEYGIYLQEKEGKQVGRSYLKEQAKKEASFKISFFAFTSSFLSPKANTWILNTLRSIAKRSLFLYFDLFSPKIPI